MLSYDEAVQRLRIIARGWVRAERQLEEAQAADGRWDGDVFGDIHSLRIATVKDDVEWHRTRLESAAWMLACVYNAYPVDDVIDEAIALARKELAS